MPLTRTQSSVLSGLFGSRGLEFLLDKNRMNVAISRAQTLAIVVGDPRIATTQASTVEQMEKLNLFCRLVQEASAQPAHVKQPRGRIAL